MQTASRSMQRIRCSSGKAEHDGRPGWSREPPISSIQTSSMLDGMMRPTMSGMACVEHTCLVAMLLRLVISNKVLLLRWSFLLQYCTLGLCPTD